MRLFFTNQTHHQLLLCARSAHCSTAFVCAVEPEPLHFDEPPSVPVLLLADLVQDRDPHAAFGHFYHDWKVVHGWRGLLVGVEKKGALFDTNYVEKN